MNLGNTAIQYLRTLIPQWAGAIIGLLVSFGIEMPEGSEVQLTTLLIAISQGLYYLASDWLSKRYKWVGWLLGYPEKPNYE